MSGKSFPSLDRSFSVPPEKMYLVNITPNIIYQSILSKKYTRKVTNRKKMQLKARNGKKKCLRLIKKLNYHFTKEAVKKLREHVLRQLNKHKVMNRKLQQKN